MISLRFILALALSVACADSSDAAVAEFNNKSLWQAAAGPFTTITFQEFAAGTVITDQYSYLGLTMTPGAIEHEPSIYPNDDYGLGNGVPIVMSFDQDRNSVAFDFPGSLVIKLYKDGALIHTSGIFGVSGIGNFGGIVSTEAFDTISISKGFTSNSSVDDMFYGAPVPAPASALLLLGFAALGQRRRR